MPDEMTSPTLMAEKIVELTAQVAALTAETAKLKADADKLEAERDAARLALAEVKHFWWPAFDKLSQTTKDEMKKAMWLVRDGALQAEWKE